VKSWTCADCGYTLVTPNPNESKIHACFRPLAPPPPPTTSAPGATFSAHKVRMDLSSPIADAATAAVFTLSASTKYKAHDWRNGLAWSKRIASLKRHLALFEAGVDIDAHLPECPPDCTAHSGLPHVDCIGASAVMLQEFFRTKGELDDRFKLAQERVLDLQRLIEGAIPNSDAKSPGKGLSDGKANSSGRIRRTNNK
jgi:hypothetical protein